MAARRRKGHKQLPETGTDEQIGVEQAKIAKYIAYRSRKNKPHPGILSGIPRSYVPSCQLQRDGQHNDGHQ